MYDLTQTQMIRHMERHQLDVYANLLGRWVNLGDDEPNTYIAPFNEWQGIQHWAMRWLKEPQEGVVAIFYRGQIYFVHPSQIQIVTNPKEKLRLPAAVKS